MEDYDILMELGSGSFGRVVKARAKSNPSTPLAIKIIKMSGLSDKEKDSALNQIRLLASIHSPNVITYHDAFFDNGNQSLCIVMEYADGGDLQGMIKRKREKGKRFNENFIWQVAYDLLKALNVLHKNRIIHRDLKPGNVFFVEGVAKLGDLNISKVTEGGFASTQAGTPYYTSPEIWNGLVYDSKCDIWSLGCLVYECATLRPPFLANDFPSLSKKINIGYYQPIPLVYSKRLSDLFKYCLCVNFKERLSAVELMKDSVFQYMHGTEEGSVDMLNTIRCPRILKLIQQKLDVVKVEVRGKSCKKIEGGREEDVRKKVLSENRARVRVGSVKEQKERERNKDKDKERSDKLKENEGSRTKIHSKLQQSHETPVQGMAFRSQQPPTQPAQCRRAVSPTFYRRI